MRIAYLCFDDGISVGGSKGSAVHVVNIANALCDIGHEVLVIAATGEKGKKNYKFDLEILPHHRLARIALRQLKKFEGTFKVASDIRLLVKLLDYQTTAAEILERFKPDCLLERYSLFCSNGINLSKKLGIPIALEINAPAAFEAAKWRSLVLQKTAARIELDAFRSADVCFTVSSELSKYVASQTGASERIVTLPNGVDIDEFNPSISPDPIRTLYDIPKESQVIGYVGGFKHWHDVPSLIKAFEKLTHKRDDVHLLLVGNGQTYSECEVLVNELGLGEQVTLTGLVLPIEVPKYVAAMDIAVAPFKDSEFFYFSPLKLFEYMSAGKCVVATCLGQIDEIIQHGENGWLCSPGNELELETALLELTENTNLRTDLGKQARIWVEKNQTWNKNASIIAEHLEGCLNVRPGLKQG